MDGRRAGGAGGAGVLEPAGAAVSPGNAAVFLLIAVLAGAVLWRRHRRLPFWARVVLGLLGALGMVLALLGGMGLL
jgi:hypothetical protein